jgi:hypothetical protein
MKPSTLLVTGALTLASSNLMAYQILESRFHVEVAPNKYVDQLVLRCEDGRQITVPWQSKLAESCGEDLMGNVTTPPAKAGSAPIDEQQKQAMLEQLRSQYGNISEKQVEFISGPSGLSTRFKPPIVEVLKKYESCRKALKDKSYCAGERDKALARLADPKPTPAAAPMSEPTEGTSREPAVPAVAATMPEAAPRSPAPGSAPQQAKTQTTAAPSEAPSRSPASTAMPQQAKSQSAVSVPEAPSPSRAPAPAAAPQQATSQAAVPTSTPTEAAPQPAAGAPAADAQSAQPSEAEARAAAEQKINQDYMACMRAKPKFDCDQARTKSMAALDKPKVVKPRKAAAGPQAQR